MQGTATSKIIRHPPSSLLFIIIITFITIRLGRQQHSHRLRHFSRRSIRDRPVARPLPPTQTLQSPDARQPPCAYNTVFTELFGVCMFVCFLCLFVCLCVLFVCLFVFVCVCVCVCVCSFVRSFVRSFVCIFLCFYVYMCAPSYRWQVWV